MPTNTQPHIADFKKGERLSAARLNEIAAAVSRLMSTKAAVHGHAYGVETPLEIMVILDADLAAATHSLTGAVSCAASVCSWSTVTSTGAETTRTETVWNHSEKTSFEAATFGVARWIEGHWIFFGDCGPMAVR